MLQRPISAVDSERETQVCRTFERLSRLMDWSQVDREFPLRGNAVCQFRREAAQLVLLPPRRLSFEHVLTKYEIFLLGKMPSDSRDWRAAFDRALYSAMQDKLTNCNYEREAYHQPPIQKTNSPK